MPTTPLDEAGSPHPFGWNIGTPLPPVWWNRSISCPVSSLMKQGNPYPLWMKQGIKLHVVLRALRQDHLRPAPQRLPSICYYSSVCLFVRAFEKQRCSLQIIDKLQVFVDSILCSVGVAVKDGWPFTALGICIHHTFLHRDKTERT